MLGVSSVAVFDHAQPAATCVLNLSEADRVIASHFVERTMLLHFTRALAPTYAFNDKKGISISNFLTWELL